MQTIFIDNKKFNLFTTPGNTSVLENHLDSRKYNQGVDLFQGSDCFSVYIYFVNKQKTNSFIEKIEKFISKIKGDTGEYEFLESFQDFHMLQAVVDNSDFDIFISNFDTSLLEEDNESLENHFEKLQNELKKIADFYLFAGADFDDVSIDMMSLPLIKYSQPEFFEKFGTTHSSFQALNEDDLFDENELNYYNIELEKVNKEKIIQFITAYFKSVPYYTNDEFCEPQIMLTYLLENFSKQE